MRDLGKIVEVREKAGDQQGGGSRERQLGEAGGTQVKPGEETGDEEYDTYVDGG